MQRAYFYDNEKIEKIKFVGESKKTKDLSISLTFAVAEHNETTEVELELIFGEDYTFDIRVIPSQKHFTLLPSEDTLK